MKMRYPLLATLLLPLAACGGSGVSCDEKIQAGDVGLCIQADWEQVPEEVLRAEGVPAETVAAFQMRDQRDGQRDNMVITRERVAASVTAMKFASSNVKTVSRTPEYTEIEQRQVTIDNKETLLHIFTARPVPDLPSRRFYQLSVVKGTTGYVITGTLPFSVDEGIEQGLITMLMSVTLEGSDQ